MNKKRILCLVLAVCLITALSVGCAQDGGSGDGGKLVYVTFWNEGEPACDYLYEVIAAFEEETGISVDFTPAGRDLLSKVRSDVLMGNPPDLIDQDFSELNAALMGDEVLVQPLNDLLDGPGPDGEARFRDIFADGDLELFAHGNDIYYVPYVKVTSGFFYDKTLFNSVGVTAPSTWDEFIAMGETLKSNGIPPLAQDGTTGLYNAYFYYWATARVLGGGKFYAAAHDPTGATWSDPGYLKAAELVFELSKGGRNFFQEGYEGSAWPAAQSDWALGKSGAILCGSWIPVETSPLVADDWDYGYFPFPTVPGGVGTLTDVEAYLMGYCVLKDAENAENAKAFIRFAMQKVWADRYVELSDNMSGRKDVAAPAVLNDVTPFLTNATSAHKIYDGVMSDLPGWWANVFYPINNNLLWGVITPEEFIEQITQGTIDYWAGNIELEEGIR